MAYFLKMVHEYYLKLRVENPLFHLKMHHECYFIQNYE